MAALTGLIAGTILYRQEVFQEGRLKTVQTRFGPAAVILTDRLAYLPRHGVPGEAFLPAHKINHPANVSALKDLGVQEVIGLNSTGSLRPSLAPGSIVLPHDYISFFAIPTVFDQEQVNITPRLSEKVRRKLKAAAAGVRLVGKGVYWQSAGPRLETRAEIDFLTQFADVVGMTMASEATVAQELGLEYASLCSVDNYAHGLSPVPLTAEEIQTHAAASAGTMLKIVEAYLEL